MSYPHLGPLLQILATIRREQAVDLDRLHTVTGLSHASLKRHIQTARDYGVVIKWEGGRQGRYVILEWGAINPAWLQCPPHREERSSS